MRLDDPRRVHRGMHVIINDVTVAERAGGWERFNVCKRVHRGANVFERAVNISVRYVGAPPSIGPNNATPPNGSTYVLYNVTIKDLNQSDYLVLPTAFMLKLSNGNFSAQPYIVGYKEALCGTNGTNTIQPGQAAAGTIVYEVPKNVSPQTVVYRMANTDGSVDERTYNASVS